MLQNVQVMFLYFSKCQVIYFGGSNLVCAARTFISYASSFYEMSMVAQSSFSMMVSYDTNKSPI